jgi:phosphopantetheinyl transferase
MMEFDRGKEQLVCRFFHPDEQDYVFAAQGQERVKRFYEIWTKKESYLKYLGTGIDCALNSFSVLYQTVSCFESRVLEDAVLTVCAKIPQCQFMWVTVDQLLSV